MTQLKNAALTACACVLALAAFGFFASVGLAALGVIALLALVGAAMTWLSAATAPKSEPADA